MKGISPEGELFRCQQEQERQTEQVEPLPVSVGDNRYPPHCGPPLPQAVLRLSPTRK